MRKDYAVGSKGALSANGARKRRVILISAVALGWSATIVFRLASLMYTDFERWQNWASNQQEKDLKLASERGAVTDRNGKLLAVSVPAGSVYLRPKEAKDKELIVAVLRDNLDLTTEQVYSKLESKSPFVWVKRQIPRAKAQQIAKLAGAGVGVVIEPRRYYPYGTGASTLLGKVGIDGDGLSGLEQVYNKQLKGRTRQGSFLRDAVGHTIDVNAASQHVSMPKGEEVRLTIDAAIQTIMDEEVEAGRIRANAQSAMGVMVDSLTGEVLALSHAPLIDLNRMKVSDRNLLKNKLVQNVYEPGSTFKPIVAAIALEQGAVRADELIYCEKGRLKFGRRTIKDVHPMEEIPFSEVIIQSSNIGMTKIGLKLGAQALYDGLRGFGFGSASGIKLPGESNGILRNVKNWAKIDVATHSFGQGVAVTPLQMVRAVSAIANGGLLPEMKIVDDSAANVGAERIISEEVAKQVREMMFGVVESKTGTGKKARIEGLSIGGKTGTAQKAKTDGRGYADGKYIASFVGFADLNSHGIDRTVTMIILVDEPDTTSIYGGTLAAPVFKRILQRSIAHLSVQRRLQTSDRFNSPFVKQVSF